jgi:rhamnosyltransferase
MPFETKNGALVSRASPSYGGPALAPGLSRITPDQVAAVTVTYNPNLQDGRFSSQMAAVSPRCRVHVIVDNHSENFPEISAAVQRGVPDPSHVHMLPLDRNEGIARALNEGVTRCRQLANPTWILTLDQDSTFPSAAFDAFDGELPQIPDFERVGILAFNYLEHRFNSSRPYNHSRGPATARSIITSGNLVRSEVFDRVRYDERLFLYFVDVDFCRKVRSLGYSIVVLRQALLDHSEGLREERDGRPRFYLDPSRLFYLSRNGLVMFVRYFSIQDPLIVGYRVAMNLVAGRRPISSLREAVRGALAVRSFLRSES